MIPFNPKTPATVLAFHNGRIIGNRYKQFKNLDEVKQYARQEQWHGGKVPYKVAVLQNGGFKAEIELYD